MRAARQPRGAPRGCCAPTLSCRRCTVTTMSESFPLPTCFIAGPAGRTGVAAGAAADGRGAAARRVEQHHLVASHGRLTVTGGRALGRPEDADRVARRHEPLGVALMRALVGELEDLEPAAGLRLPGRVRRHRAVRARVDERRHHGVVVQDDRLARVAAGRLGRSTGQGRGCRRCESGQADQAQARKPSSGRNPRCDGCAHSVSPRRLRRGSRRHPRRYEGTRGNTSRLAPNRHSVPALSISIGA